VTAEPATVPYEPAASVEAAYEALFAAHFASLVRLAGLLGAEDPEDVAQEAFVRLHSHRGTLRDPAAAPAWLTRAVVNLTRSRGRRLRMARRRTPHDVATAPAAEATAVERAEHRAVVAALDTLTARQRRVLVLRYWLDLPLAEIAATLGVPLGTVKSNHSRGLAAVARHLEEQ
jgi:RNA polymerase sigma factor (sigma-70 family)